jgi:hypothetical protein
MHVIRCCNSCRQKCDQERNPEDLEIQISQNRNSALWNVKTKVISVIIGATGTILKSLRQYLSNIPGKSEIKEQQKTGHIGHCTYSAGGSNLKYKTLLHGPNNITCSTDCKYRAATKQYTI